MNLKDLNILSFEYNLRQFVPIFTRDERQPQDTDAIIKFISSGRLAMPTTMRWSRWLDPRLIDRFNIYRLWLQQKLYGRPGLVSFFL